MHRVRAPQWPNASHARRYGEELPAHWRAVLTRGTTGEASGKGALWGVPHSWSPTLIAYNHRLFSEAGLKPIHDWLDLLQPRLAAKVRPSHLPAFSIHHCRGSLPCMHE